MLFFEREIEVFLSTNSIYYKSDSTDTIKLAVLSGASIDYNTNSTDIYNYKIEDSPKRNKEKTIIGYSNPVLKFNTYAKPYGDTVVEKLLLYSLTGTIGTESAGTYTTSFASVYKLPELFIYVKIGTLIYFIKNAVVTSVNYRFDLNQILTTTWELKGLELVRTNNIPSTYTDYTNVSNYIKSNFAALSFTFTKPYEFNIYLDGSDLLNKGTETATITNYGASLTTIAGKDCYLIDSPLSSSTNKIVAENIKGFTGEGAPNDNVGSWIVEFEFYIDAFTGVYPKYYFNFFGDTGSYLYANSSGEPFRAYMFGKTFAPGIIGGYANPTLTDLGVSLGTWNHCVVICDYDSRIIHAFCNGKPMFGWIFDVEAELNNTLAATTGIAFGGYSTKPFNIGYLTNLGFSYNTDTLKYSYDYGDYTERPLEEDTVVYITNSYTDNSVYGHTVTNNGTIDQGDYLESELASTADFTVATSSAWNSTNWAIEFDFMYSATGIPAGTVFDDGSRRLYFTGSGYLAFGLSASTNLLGFNTVGQNDYIVPQNIWKTFCVEKRNNEYYLYIDGKFIAGTTTTVYTFNSVPIPGPATFISTIAGTSMAIKNIKISSNYKRTADYFKPATYTYTGKLPIINGSVKLENTLKIAERNTLASIVTEKLDHYVEDRSTDVNIVGYTKTGNSTSLSNYELFDLYNEDPLLVEEGTIAVNLRIGKDDESKVEFILPNAFIELPKIRIEDVITSNINISGKEDTTENDDITIKYTS